MTRTLLIAATLLVLTGCNAAEEKRPSVESQVLLKSTSSWNGTPYRQYPQGQPELTILKVNIPANTEMKWHRHPIPNAAYVVSGQLTVQAKDTPDVIQLKAGDTLAEMVDIMHRGVTGNEPVELIVFYAGTPGTPLSQ
jgi:quercetin dioxygenase-like cupin family protein